MQTTLPPPPTHSSPSTKRRTKGPAVVRWIEANCVHTNGEWIGQPFRLLDWEKRFLYQLFEVDEDGTRRYRWALLGLSEEKASLEDVFVRLTTHDRAADAAESAAAVEEVLQ